MELRGGALQDPDATLDDLREAVATLEETERPRGAFLVPRAHPGI